jgi:hypothetical protein
MATQPRHKVKKHITLSADVAEALETAAREAKVTLSDVIEARVREPYQAAGQSNTILDVRLEQLAADLADLRAKVLPLVATVTAILQQMEGELPGPLSEAKAPAVKPKIATYEDMYGPIRPVSPAEPTPSAVLPKRRRPWP